MTMGKRDPRQMPRALRRLCGQVSIVPSGVDDQSLARTAEPMSPPPTNQQVEEVGSEVGCVVDARSTMPPFPRMTKAPPNMRWREKYSNLSFSFGGPGSRPLYVFSKLQSSHLSCDTEGLIF